MARDPHDTREPEMYIEFRAVFSYPASYLGPSPDSYGPWVRTVAEALKQSPLRPEETHGYRSGMQKRFTCQPVLMHQWEYEPKAVPKPTVHPDTFHDHKPKQHRDNRPPWCNTCGLTADGKIPERRNA